MIDAQETSFLQFEKVSKNAILNLMTDKKLNLKYTITFRKHLSTNISNNLFLFQSNFSCFQQKFAVFILTIFLFLFSLDPFFNVLQYGVLFWRFFAPNKSYKN